MPAVAIAPPSPAVGQKLGDDRLELGDRHSQHAATARGAHSQNVARTRDQRPARVAGVEGDVRTDDLSPAAAPSPPERPDGRDDAERGAQGAARSADRQADVADARGRGPRRRQPGKLHSDKGYNYRHLRRWLAFRGIRHRLARKDIESSRRLGRHR